MKKVVLLFFVFISMSGCYITYKTPQSKRGTRPFFYSPRTHYGPIYKHPRRKQMKPHFNKELPR